MCQNGKHSLSDYAKQLKNGRIKECLKIFELIKNKKALVKEFKTNKKEGKNKILHGQIERQTENKRALGSCLWLKRGTLKRETGN